MREAISGIKPDYLSRIKVVKGLGERGLHRSEPRTYAKDEQEGQKGTVQAEGLSGPIAVVPLLERSGGLLHVDAPPVE